MCSLDALKKRLGITSDNDDHVLIRCIESATAIVRGQFEDIPETNNNSILQVAALLYQRRAMYCSAEPQEELLLGSERGA
ncbi:hypothetical protein AGMMS49992_19390 [Clostridia bacterium]|nr:hypothetical protein AGMMS49992_19390 [Clostridia bacterium]